MKKVSAILAVLAVMCIPSVGRADECVTASFADYIALGSEGCTIGDKVFYDFDYASGGDFPISADQVTVKPDDSDPLNPGLLFTTAWVTEEGEILDSHIEFTVSTLSGEALIEDASLSITDWGVNEGGSVTVAENLCLGGTFIGGNCSSGLTDQLLVSTSLGVFFDHTTFAPVSTVDVIKDIGLEANGAGDHSFAFTSGVTNNFSQIPEPASLTLLGTGLVAIGGMVRRRLRANPTSK